MEYYSYKSLNSEGKEVRGNVDAEDIDDAVKIIRDKGLFPIRVRSESDRSTVFSKVSSFPNFLTLKRPLTTMEKVMITIISLQFILIAGLIKQIMTS